VLAISAEYGTGTIRSSLAAVPDRRTFLAAKAAVFALVVLVVGEVVSFAAFFIGQVLISGGAPHHHRSARRLACRSRRRSYLALLGLLALGLGSIIRHTAGAIAAFVGVLLIIPLILPALPTSLNDAISKIRAGHHRQRDDERQHAPRQWCGPDVQCLGGPGHYGRVRRTALGIGGWRMMRRTHRDRSRLPEQRSHVATHVTTTHGKA